MTCVECMHISIPGLFDISEVCAISHFSHSFNSYNNTFSINIQFLNVENVKINYMEKLYFLFLLKAISVIGEILIT